MVFLAYFLTAILFVISETIFTSITLLIVTMLGSILLKKPNSNLTFAGQFLGIGVGVFFAGMLSLLMFKWLDVTPNVIICSIMFIFLWWFVNNVALTNVDQLKKFNPNGQRLGAIIGIIVFYLFMAY